jgi:hypothetical protein
MPAKRTWTGRHAPVLLAAAMVLAGSGVLPATGETAPAPPAAGTGAPPATSNDLPRGGRSVLPEHRVIAHYGAPQAEALGILGIGTPPAAGARLERHARTYAGPGRRPVLPAMELIAVIVNAGPGRDGQFRTRQARAVIRRYLRAARKARALLILDVQPGRSDFVTEARALAEFLVEPDVGLALDPEWRMAPGQVPGRVIGSVDAAEINAVTSWLAGLVARRNLPDKLVIVHQFTDGMIRRRGGLRAPPGVDLVLNADGFGTASAKIDTYRRVTRDRRGLHAGFKLFFVEDTGLMTPAEVLRLRPAPELVVYE